MTPQSPRALVLQLAANINDDGMIIAHVKREFGVTYSKQDIARIRATKPVKFGRATPVALAHADRVVKIGAEDKLLAALAKQFHRTKPDEKEHWERVERIASGCSYEGVK